MGIKQVAELANVSIGTVDRVLHKRAGVSVKTREKVLKIIKDTGYTTNTTASRFKLASKKKIKIAVLIPKSKSEWSYWKLPKKGIVKAVKELAELGVEAEFFNFSDSVSFAEQSERIFLQEYDSIVAVPFFRKASNHLLQQAKAKSIPVVFLDTEIELESPAHFIRQNSFTAGMVGGRLLRGLVGSGGQYLIVNIINDKGIHANGKQREEGFRAFFSDNEKGVDIQSINHPIKGEFVVGEQLSEWFGRRGSKGIFVTNSRSHLIPPILKKYKIDRSFVVGFDMNKENIECLKKDEISFIINQKPLHQGYTAIKGIFNLLTKQDSSNLDLDIPVDIIVKENIIDRQVSSN